MSFKDFVAFLLRMSGFWLVIDTLVGISSASLFISDAANFGSYGSQLPLIVVSVAMPVLIGVFLALMPYKITNFLVLDN